MYICIYIYKEGRPGPCVPCVHTFTHIRVNPPAHPIHTSSPHLFTPRPALFTGARSPHAQRRRQGAPQGGRQGAAQTGSESGPCHPHPHTHRSRESEGRRHAGSRRAASARCRARARASGRSGGSGGGGAYDSAAVRARSHARAAGVAGPATAGSEGGDAAGGPAQFWGGRGGWDWGVAWAARGGEVVCSAWRGGVATERAAAGAARCEGWPAHTRAQVCV